MAAKTQVNSFNFRGAFALLATRTGFKVDAEVLDLTPLTLVVESRGVKNLLIQSQLRPAR